MQSIAVCTSSAGAPKTWTSGTAEGTDLSCVLAVHHAARHDVALDAPFKRAIPAFALNILNSMLNNMLNNISNFTCLY